MQPRVIAWIVIVPVAVLIAGCTSGPDPTVEAERAREPESAALLGALSSGDADVRARAALAMGRIQSPSYAEALSVAATGDDLEVRLAALFALGQIGLAEGAEAVGDSALTCANATRDDDPAIVAAAVECLGKLAAPGTDMILTPLMKHDDPAVRVAVADALMRMRFVPVLRGETETPPSFGDDAVAALVGALEDGDARVRTAAAHAISRYGEPTAAARAARLEQDGDEFVRMFGVRCVARSDATDLAEEITWGLGDPSYHVRAETVSGLARLERIDLLPPALAGDRSFHVRAAYATALGAAEDRPTLESLRKLLADESPTVRTAAIGSLAGRLDAAYVEELAELVKDENWVIRNAATGAAAQLGEPGVPVLRTALEDVDPRVRATALGSVPVDDLDAVRPRLMEAIESDDQALRAAAVGRVPEIPSQETLGWLVVAYDRSNADRSDSVRDGVIDALAKIGGEQSDALLRAIAVEDPDFALREKATEILADRGIEAGSLEPDPYEPPPVHERSFDEDPVVVLETDRGTMEIRLFPDEAPLHVSNLVGLVQDGMYDGKIWHRVVTNFVIQGGDPEGNGWGGPGYTIPDEINRLRYRRGSLGMPKGGKDTGGCQLFVNHVPTPHLDGNYTVYGQVVSGLDVIDGIEIGDRIVRATVK